MVETERLIFKRYTHEDLDLLLGMTTNPNIMKYIRHGNPWTREETLESISRFISWNDEGIGLHLAFSKENGKLIGHSGLIPQVIEGNQELEVGYWVVEDEWGKGFGFEQAKAWKEYGMTILKHKRLISLIQYGNNGSMRVAAKNGMTHLRDIDLLGKKVAIYGTSL